jgi:hypothetical protein
VERVPVERVPVERVPVERVPVERVPVERVPAERVPVERVLADRQTQHQGQFPWAESAPLRPIFSRHSRGAAGGVRSINREFRRTV